MRPTSNLAGCDCWTEKVGLHLPGVVRAGCIAQLSFPKRQGGAWAEEVRLAFSYATSNTTLKAGGGLASRRHEGPSDQPSNPVILGEAKWAHAAIDFEWATRLAACDKHRNTKQN